MKLIDQKVHFFKETPTDFMGCLKLIERAGRTCYGSEDKISAYSAWPFVQGLIKRGHMSVLRHSNLVLPWESDGYKYLKETPYRTGVITGGNWQAWLECHEQNDSQMDNYLEGLEAIHKHSIKCPKELKRYTCHLTTSLRNSHQLVRHTTLAVSQKSTRYCDHSNLEIIKPWWWDDPAHHGENCAYCFMFSDAMAKCESDYIKMICRDFSKEDAADVLPKATATEMWLTGDRDCWLNIKAQRLSNSTGKAARQMQELMKLIPWEVIE